MIPHIYILILNWNGNKVLKSCIDSVLAIDYPNYTTLVVDNNSTDGSRKIIKDYHPSVEYLQLENNFGFSGGYNRCFNYLKEKDTNYILLLNNDTEVAPDILHCFIDAVLHYGDHNIFGGKIFYHSNKQKVWYAGGQVNLKFGKISHKGIRKMNSPKLSFHMETDYVSGCCLFTTMEVINKLNGFDESYNMYGEDVDLCIRAEKLGIKSYYWPDARLWHHVSSSLGGEYSLKKQIKKMRSILRLIIKHHY